VGNLSQKLTELGKKAREGTISIDDMAGGTFTISNGGVYGSLLSTPIINPPQVGCSYAVRVLVRGNCCVQQLLKDLGASHTGRMCNAAATRIPSSAVNLQQTMMYDMI
jgi:hypothetical protein